MRPCWSSGKVKVVAVGRQILISVPWFGEAGDVPFDSEGLSVCESEKEREVER